MNDDQLKGASRSAQSHPHPRVRLLVSIGVVLIIGGMMFLAYRQKLQESRLKNPTKLPYNQNMSKAVGSMRVVFDDNRSVFSVGEPIVFSVYADTHDRKVLGFDVVLNIPSAKAKLMTVESLQTGMTVHANQLSDALFISGVNEVSQTKVPNRAFANEPIVRVTLKPFVTTALPILLRFTPDETADSNLVMEDAHDILGSAEGAIAHIGTVHTLVMGATQKITPDMTMTLQPMVTPAPQCADCLTTVPVLVSSGGISTVVSFEFGGIAGRAYATHETDAGVIEATILSPTSLQITFAPL